MIKGKKLQENEADSRAINIQLILEKNLPLAVNVGSHFWATPPCVYGQNILASIFGIEPKDWTPANQACQLSLYPSLGTTGCES